MKWAVSQIGARRHYAIPRMFSRNDELKYLITDIWSGGKNYNIQFFNALKSLENRFHPELINDKIISNNLLFILMAAFLKVYMKTSYNPQIFFHYQDIFFDTFTKAMIKRFNISEEITHFFGYNSTSLETIKYLKKKKIITIINQVDPGIIEKKIINNEQKKWQNLAKNQTRIYGKYYRRIKSEWALADKVIVNSEWSRKSLVAQGVDKEKLLVIPLAYEPNTTNFKKNNSKKRLRVLWLGTVNLRKGIQYLLLAAEKLLDLEIEIKVIGPIEINLDNAENIPENIQFYGKVSRDNIENEYLNADVFILPTLSDGFGITQLEAMSHNLPVIATKNCGEVVRNGYNGFIIKPYSHIDIIKALRWCYHNREDLKKMAINAKNTAKKYSLDNIHEMFVESL